MMLFKPYHVDPILGDRKTATRRAWVHARVKVGSRHRAKTEMLSRKSFASLLITAVYKQPLNKMTVQDARKEGYDSLKEYGAAFVKIFGIKQWMWFYTRPLFVVEFQRVK